MTTGISLEDLYYKKKSTCSAMQPFSRYKKKIQNKKSRGIHYEVELLFDKKFLGNYQLKNNALLIELRKHFYPH